MRRWMCRRNALIFCVPAVLGLTSCTAAEQATEFSPKRDPAYTTQAEMEYGDGQKAALELTRCTESLWEASFSEPASLAGVVLTFDGDAVSASYKGLAFTVPKSAFGAKNMLMYVTETLDNAAAETLICSQQEDGSWINHGECAGGAYTLTFSESGEPLMFDLPSQPLKLTFTSYTVSPEAAVTTDPIATSSTEAAAPMESTTTITTENNEGASN
ncbi:MAG: hypothetical protein MJ065_03285 [Oscillospiraceae bacterium]|nr:hypothetical protein [Oscillospiraceae bacterium]